MEKKNELVPEAEIPMMDIDIEHWWRCVTSVSIKKKKENNTLEIIYDKSRLGGLSWSENEKPNPKTIVVPIHGLNEPSKENEFPSIHLKFNNRENLVSFRVIRNDTELAKLAELFKKNKLSDEGCSHTIFLTEVNSESFENFNKTTEKNEIEVDVNFSFCYFNNIVDFTLSTFKNEANFNSSTFKDMANFHKSIFDNEENFTLSTFNDIADFHKSTFNHTANFWLSTFNDIADFTSSTFKSEADFNSSTFKDMANFHKSTFTHTADFSSSNFNNTADFNSSNFKDMANFWSSTFNHEVKFSSSTFNNTAYFWSSTFNHEAKFSSSTFKQELRFISLEKVKFIDISNAEVKFLNIRYSRVPVRLSLKGAQVEKIDFTDANIESSPNRETFTILKNIAIKQNDQISALDFHKKEMSTYFKELEWGFKGLESVKNLFKKLKWKFKRLKLVKNLFKKLKWAENWVSNFSRKFILWIESWVSNYGTSYMRAGISIVVFNFLIALINNFVLPSKPVTDSMWQDIFIQTINNMNIFDRVVFEDKPKLGKVIHFFRLAGNAFLYYELIKSFRMFSRKL